MVRQARRSRAPGRSYALPAVRGALLAALLVGGWAETAPAQSASAPRGPGLRPGYESPAGRQTLSLRRSAPSTRVGDHLTLSVAARRRLGGTRWESIAGSAEWSRTSATGRTLGVGALLLRSDLSKPLEIGPTATIPEGAYDSHLVRVRLATATGAPPLPHLQLTTGSFLGGWTTDLALASPHLRLGPLELRGSQRAYLIRPPRNGAKSRGRTARVDMRLRLLPGLVLSGAADHHAPAGWMAGYLSVSIRPGRAGELEIGYDGGIAEAGTLAPPRPSRTPRTVRIHFRKGA